MALRNPVKYRQYRGHQRVTAPASEPITPNDVKTQLELDTSDTSFDSQLELYISAAREQAEAVTGLALITQTWKLTLDHWPNAGEPWWDGVRQGAITDLYSSGRPSDIILPRYPLQSVDSVTADGDSVTVADTFIEDTQQEPGRLVIKRGATWPVVLDNANGIGIEYTAGYGDNAEDVPATIRLALTQMAAHMFEHRGDGCTSEDAYRKSGAKAMLDRYKAVEL
jgi:uncharacterized phiE125 gp8 family phage protein